MWGKLFALQPINTFDGGKFIRGLNAALSFALK